MRQRWASDSIINDHAPAPSGSKVAERSEAAGTQPSTASTPEMLPLPPSPAILDGVRLRAYRALHNERQDLANWYLAGRGLAEDQSQSEHLVLAAHEIREIIEKLIDAALAPGKVSRRQLGDRVEDLKRRWPHEVVTRHAGDWPPDELERLRPFLLEAQKLFAPDGEWKPARASEMETFLETRDPLLAVGGANADARARLKAWKDLRDYFVGVCHHRVITTREEFAGRMAIFDALVIEVLGPQVFPEYAEIDRLLQEGEDAS